MPTSSEATKPLTAVLVIHETTSADDSGIVGPYLESLGHDVLRHEVFPSGDTSCPDVDLPSLNSADIVVVFGSTEHAWEDRHAPWVKKETDWIREALQRRLPVVGICFGCQLLALALGGSVRPTGSYEVGMLVFPTSADCPFPGGPWFSWHSDAVSLPDGVTVWSASKLGPQIFVHGTGLGVQFHPEVDVALADAWIGAWPDDLPTTLTSQQFGEDVRRHAATAQASCRAIIDWALAPPTQPMDPEAADR